MSTVGLDEAAVLLTFVIKIDWTEVLKESLISEMIIIVKRIKKLKEG